MSGVAHRPSTRSFLQLSSVEKWQAVLEYYPVEAKHLIALIEFLWKRKERERRREIATIAAATRP